MSRKTEAQYLAELCRGFVGNLDGCMVITSRRQTLAIGAANYGLTRGWLTGEWDTSDEQSHAYICRLTERGRAYFSGEAR